MIGNLLSNALQRKAPAQETAAAVEPATAVAASAPAEPPAPPALETEREAFLRQKAYEHSAAQLWLLAQQLQHSLLAEAQYADPKRLERHGWKAYSQNDEDGILAEIFRRIGVVHKSFVEFGCGDGLENNTAYLLAQGWRGLWIDGAEANITMIGQGFAPLIERGALQIRQAFIDRDNVDGLIATAALGPEIDLLSIDVDGNDYHFWEAVRCVNPRVVAIEYNAKFRPPLAWCMAYSREHQWSGSDAMGASLGALARLGAARGYRLVGCNLTGVNAFFVRQDLAAGHFAEPATPEHLFQPPRYDLIYAYRGGHGASSLAIVQSAYIALGLPPPTQEQIGSTYKPELP
ncbi:MAG: hypothetical protein JWN73_2113 [Betaproteobacteria bacterium]|nr:hypothetical protein [Betaproteobacteria bacterium]